MVIYGITDETCICFSYWTPEYYGFFFTLYLLCKQTGTEIKRSHH